MAAIPKTNTDKLHGLVGRDCTIDCGRDEQKFIVNAKIIDAKLNFGRTDVKLQPISGGGSCWFSREKVKVVGRNA